MQVAARADPEVIAFFREGAEEITAESGVEQGAPSTCARLSTEQVTASVCHLDRRNAIPRR